MDVECHENRECEHCAHKCYKAFHTTSIDKIKNEAVANTASNQERK